MKWFFLATESVHCSLLFCFLVFSSYHTTETINVTATGNDDVIKVGSDVDKDPLQATARLLDVILHLPVVKHKVAPVTTLASGDVGVIVDVDLLVRSVLYLDDAKQTMTITTYIEVQWQDISLMWNPGDYNDVTWVETSQDSIWIPTLILINSQAPVNIMSHAANLVVHSKKTVRAAVYYKTVTFCTMDHSQLPYDTQRCHLILESASDYCQISLTFMFMKQSDSKSLMLKSDWELVSAERDEVSNNVPGYLPLLQLRLRRRTVYFSVCLVLPLVLTSYMNTLVFLLPVQCEEKFSFLVTIFVSTSVFLGFFKDVMPRGLDTVLATMKLLVGVLLGSLLVLLATVLVTWRHHHLHHHPSPSDLHRRYSPLPTPTSPREGFTAFSQTTPAQDVSYEGGEYSRQYSGDSATGKDKQSAESVSGCQLQSFCEAEKLDRVLFLVAFVINTVFLAAIFFKGNY